MLTAKDTQKNSTVVATQLTKAEATKKNQYVCISCKQRVILKQGRIRKSHFAHFTGSECSAFSENESKEHLLLKEQLAKWCSQEQLSCQLEAYLPEIQQRPDLLIGSVALEIQCSSLSLNRLVERTRQYKENGYQPVWMVGSHFQFKGKLSALLKSFASYSEKLGFYIWQVDANKKEIRLYYQIKEYHFGNTLFQVKSWPFFSSSFLDILRYPDRAEIMHQCYGFSNESLTGYYLYLQKGLRAKHSATLSLQETCYTMGEHLLYLPYFFYYSFLSYFYLKDGGLNLRLILWKKLKRTFDSLEDFMKACQRIICEKKNVEFYPFTLVSKAQLQLIFCQSIISEWTDCGILYKKGEKWHFNPTEKITSLDELKQKDNAFISVTSTKI